MEQVHILTISDDDNGQRLDRWLKKQLPKVPYALIQKMVRTGQIRINGKRAKTDTRLTVNDSIRIPPVETKSGPSIFIPKDDDESFLKKITLYDDGEILVINKPYGLPVQGGPNITRHIDGMLSSIINKKGVKPRLIHRLDRDTSGLLVCARSLKMTQNLGALFESRDIKKIYYALVSPIPKEKSGIIDGAIIKGTKGDRKEAVIIDNDNGKASRTLYKVIAENKTTNIAWLAFWPRTGRMHQIRVHTADILGCPILGDEKYNGMSPLLDELDLSHRLHLHAAHLIFRHPTSSELLKLSAPLPDDLKNSFAKLGFDLYSMPDPFDPPKDKAKA
jgi:23S rRNA pseudouridine955/2504/2580 synthase